MPLSLSGAEYDAVQAAAAPIHPQQRDAFLKALAVELECYPVVGPGVVHRVAAELQKTFAVTGHIETAHAPAASEGEPGGRLSDLAVRRPVAAESPSAGRPPGPRQRHGEGPARGRRDAGSLTSTYYWGYSYCGEDHLRCR
jgi:hypothetical protein